LFDLDEGFYGAVVAEMNRRGEWITPYYLGTPWFEKPILLYWLAKPAVILFGKGIGPRLPSVLATLGLYSVCGLYVVKRVSTAAGMWSVGILGSSLLLVALGRMMTPDAILTLCLSSAFVSFYESLVGDRRWRVLTALCLGLAVLAKGPVSLVWFIALAIWTWASEKELRPAFRGYWLLGTFILILTISSWYVPAYLQNGQVFIQEFLIKQNLQRFGGGDEAHRVPLVAWPVYYPIVLLFGMLPWSLFAGKPWMLSLQRTAPTFHRFLGRWALIVLIFFTISGTKLPHYILPAVPPIAMLVALSFAERRAFSWATVIATTLVVAVLVHGAFVAYYGLGGFAELDKVAIGIDRTVARPAVVVGYQLARTNNDPRGPLGLNWTSDPSLGFYIDDPHIHVLELPKENSNSPFAQLQSVLAANSGQNFIVITRPLRISPEDLTQLDATRQHLAIEHSGRHYAVYKRQVLVAPPTPGH